MEASAQLWRPLGAILIARGLLTLDQLDEALEVQRQTGQRLGEILTDLELVPRDVLVSVLLEQCGIEAAETQDGFGSGLLHELRRRGSAHRRTSVSLSVVRPADDAASIGRRRRLGRRHSDETRERAQKIAAAFTRVEEWTRELQDDIVKMRRLISETGTY